MYNLSNNYYNLEFIFRILLELLFEIIKHTLTAINTK